MFSVDIFSKRQLATGKKGVNYNNNVAGTIERLNHKFSLFPPDYGPFMYDSYSRHFCYYPSLIKPAN